MTETDTRTGFTIEHLDFARRLIDAAARAGVAIRYCSWNHGGWGVMTTPELNDAEGAAFLASLDAGPVGEASQSEPKNRSIFAGTELLAGIRLWVKPISGDDTDEKTEQD